MPLTDREIRARVAPFMRDTFSEGVSGPGIISYGVSSMGYDFRLGERVKLFTNAHSPVIDPLDFDPKALVDLVPSSVTRRYPHPDRPGEEIEREYRYVTVPPGGYILAETVEYLEVPRDVIVVVLGKSTYARSALIVNCTPLEPGWRGYTTLEIGNFSDSPARYYLGMGIAQALFFSGNEWEGSRLPGKVYGERSKRYQDQGGLTLPTVVDTPAAG
jgi:dCTP deaminase